MKYVDEFRDRRLIDKVAREIRRAADADRAYRFMEVCGTHTMNIFRFGLRGILPENIDLISGPGCPVCVTPNGFVDTAIALCRRKDVAIATFGDMMKVPGSRSSLEKERAAGAEIKTVYSSVDALEMAKRRPEREIVFLGIGFETTAPTVARSILMARKERVANYSVLCGNKTMPGALKALAGDACLSLDGFLLPGHVSAVIGCRPYGFLARLGKSCVVSGFEPLDIMQSILMLIRQKAPKIEVQYTRIINKSGNRLAQTAMKDVFDETASSWRGIGRIEKSGLKIKKAFSAFDAETKFRPKIARPKENRSCVCGDVIKGVKRPDECKLFAGACNPEHPVGACMVSSEGTCAAYYKYR